MQLTIHRGANQIGGTCLEVSHDGSRLALDVGLPLEPEDDPKPKVPGLFADDGAAFDGIVLSHAHADHSGLLSATRRAPVWMTKGTSQMMMAGALFARQPDLPQHRQRTLSPLRPTKIGAFTVTALPVDHSAYGAVALLVEAGGKRLLYTGDLRFHGRKPGMGIQLERTCKNLDVLVIEGTRLGQRAGEENVSEADLETKLVPEVKDAPSLVLAMYSPLNVDRFTTFFRTARRSGRTLVIDPYQAFVLHLIHRDAKVPVAGGPPDLRVLIPPRFATTRAGRALIAKAWWRKVPGAAIAPAEIMARPHKHLVLFRSGMERWLCPAGLPSGTTCIHSYWPGYLTKDPRMKAWAESFQRRGRTLLLRHASGHATAKDLFRFAKQLQPKKVVPVHTDHPEAWSPVEPAPYKFDPKL